jgi:hypothetical protein
MSGPKQGRVTQLLIALCEETDFEAIKSTTKSTQIPITLEMSSRFIFSPQLSDETLVLIGFA